MKTPHFAAIQMTSSDNVQDNLTTVEKWVEVAVKKGAEYILLPENFSFMGRNERDKLSIAESYGEGPIQSFLAKLASRHHCWIIGGTLPILACPHPQFDADPHQSTALCTASCLVWNPNGQCVARYDKIHLFDVEIDDVESHVESRTIFPGNKVVSLETPIGKLGLSICYDLRFPELYRRLLNEGAIIFTVPSAFTQKTGQAHWEILLRARAIENFSYVIAANQSGVHKNGRTTFGHSMIVDPWGKIIDLLPEGEGIVMAPISQRYLQDIRRRFPVLAHQRLV